MVSMPSLRNNSIRAGPTPLRNWALSCNGLEEGAASMGMFSYVISSEACLCATACSPRQRFRSYSARLGEQAVAHCQVNCQMDRLDKSLPICLGRSLEQALSFRGMHAWSGVL